MITVAKKPTIWLGALFGALFTAPLMALFFLGERFASLPFLPLDFFNWVSRMLPGGLLTFGIDTMVDSLISLGFGSDIDSAAKASERTIGLSIFLFIGIIAGLLFFFVLNRIEWRERSTVPGLVLAVLVGLPLTFLGLQGDVSATAPFFMQIIWLGLLFIGWGTAFSWAYNELSFSDALVNSKNVEAEKTQVETSGIDRRQFIVRVGGASATLTVLGVGLGTLLNAASQSNNDGTIQVVSTNNANTVLPNTGDSVIPASGTRPEITPIQDHYRIDILAGGTPSIPANYTLPITGLVENPVEWSLEEIAAMPSMSDYITMSCISNRLGGSLISTVKWTGVSYQYILDQIKPTAQAHALKITGYDGFDEYIDLDIIRNDERVMLVYAWDDKPLPDRNGYPLRTHIPNRYGMKQPKWIQSVEVVDAWEPGYWVRRGWSRDAIVNTVSVIDTVATSDVYKDASGQMYVPIGGIAWSGARGIVRVEVSVDGGEWVEAKLRKPLSDRTWVIWRYDWPFVEGSHTFEVRAYEPAPNGQGDPILQPTQPQGTRPDGATGIYSRTATLAAADTSTANG